MGIPDPPSPEPSERGGKKEGDRGVPDRSPSGFPPNVTVRNRRKVAMEEGGARPVEPEIVEEANRDAGSTLGGAVVVEEGHDYLEDLRRVQAEFENYRKRMMKDQARIAEQANARLVKHLLPVLDDFDRAVGHGEASPGIELIYKQLLAVLETEGLEEIPAAGQTFDPSVHEAVASHEADVDEPRIDEVYRRGYRFKGLLLRPAMVVVARPREQGSSEVQT